MKRGILILSTTLAAMAVLPFNTTAQNLSESVTVEGRYQAEVIPADRLSLPPTALTLKVPESPMSYDRKGVTAAFAPDALPMVATGWRATKTFDTSKGYVSLMLGSWLNSSLSAGYNAVNTDYTRLNVYLQHNSTSLWQAWKKDEAAGFPAADRRFRYDETIGAELQHRIAGTGTLSATAKYHLGYFNYYGTDKGQQEAGRIKAPTQTLNDVYGRIEWTGTPKRKLSYGAFADVRYFGYRAMYVPNYIAIYPAEFTSMQGERETALNIGGKMAYKVAKKSIVDVAVRYSGVFQSIGNDVNRVELVPAYVVAEKTYSLRIGANAAVAGNGERTRFRIAPDISFDTRKGQAAFSASIGGGTHLRTLAWEHEMDYYSNPAGGIDDVAYTPLDIRLALQLNPGGRWTFGVEGEWRTTLDETLRGNYQAFLNGYTLPDDAFPASGHLHGFSLGVNAGYEFSRYLSLNGKCSWQPQKGSKGILNGFDRPAFTAEISAESKPIERLTVGIDYNLRAKRLLLPGNLSRLDLRGEYRITDKISVGAEINNLLNRHEDVLPGLPLEGINAAAGVQIVF